MAGYPFFHEMPAEQNLDFFCGVPHILGSQQGQEITEITLSNKYVWEYFEKVQVLETFLRFQKGGFKDDPRLATEWNRVAQKILWTVAFYEHVKEINEIAKEL